MPIPKVKSNETENEYVSRCMEAIGGEYDDNAQAVAICYSTYRRVGMSKIKSYEELVAARIKFDSDFRGIKLADNGLEGACWEGWKALGTKIVDGREVPNCIPEEDHPDTKG